MSIPDSDTESTVSSQTRPTTATTTKSHHQHQVFPFAYPPPKSTSCLRFTSRLLLQIQQLLSASRALPVLEVYRPSSLGKSISGCPSKLHSQDLYVVQSDSYQTLASSYNSNHEPTSTNAVVGVIYTNYTLPCRSNNNNHNTSSATSSGSVSTTTTDHKSQPTSSPSTTSTSSSSNNAIHFPQLQITFLAARTSRGGYIFHFLPTSSSSSPTTTTNTKRLTLELAKKKPKRKSTPPRSSASPTPDDEDDDDNAIHEHPPPTETTPEPASFLLGLRGNSSDISAPPPRSRPWLARLSHKGIKVLQGEQQDHQRRRLLAELGLAENSPHNEIDVLYTLVLMMGVYAAKME
ncbi:uncharacterized protein BP01DRAFT_422381, partial [Aspergillus saccharolyticus JOP 1030-1]